MILLKPKEAHELLCPFDVDEYCHANDCMAWTWFNDDVKTKHGRCSLMDAPSVIINNCKDSDA